MNSVLYNYKYMYRHCRNIWTYVSESESEFAEKRTAKLGFLTSEQLHRPIPPPPPPPPRSTDPCPAHGQYGWWNAFAARLSHTGLLFSFFFFISFLWRNERHFRKILNSFLLEFRCGERYLAAAEKSNCVVPPSLAWPDWRQPTGELCGKSAQIKGELQFPERCTTEL